MLKGFTISGGIGLLIGIALVAYLRRVAPAGAPTLDGHGMVVTVVLCVVVMTVFGGLYSWLRQLCSKKKG
ncbi:hypothetical protein KM176_20860 [Pseudooceanicola sp. CBS1P-1]|uniref:Uncharacterized protein n=1 Tax=Pseudooceanicola albus TaxID=2692189 RepID=A0A6L7GBU1_9RHOB|nr:MULTISPECIES: hypothetical protein [Pseudooceanicola]MBT9386333.1 hypothetical protein [Pseudooceanicola endophyticus]MXN21172.1 hypothetical protein [Pseudooceanicola albus]